MEEQQKQYKKVDIQLLQHLIEVIARSKTDLTYLQMQEVFKMVQESEDIEEDDSGEDEPKQPTKSKKR